MFSRSFKIGSVYHATPALVGQPRRLAALIGRDGASLQFAFVDELSCGMVELVCDRETAQLETEIGTYNVSAAVPANANETAIINSLLQRSA